MLCGGVETAAEGCMNADTSNISAASGGMGAAEAVQRTLKDD